MLKGGKDMGHHKHCASHCKYNITFENDTKKLHPGHPSYAQGKVAFCEQVRGYPIGTHLKRRCN